MKLWPWPKKTCPAGMQVSIDAASAQRSYSQCAEDIIAGRVLGRLRISPVRYLDIGANHPVKLNNTFKLYQQGGSGVLVEPNPVLCEQLRRERPRDTVLQAGVALESGSAPFYVMSNPYLSTFDKTVAERTQAEGHVSIERVEDVPVTTLQRIIADHFPDGPHFVSLDIEGLDFELLQDFDFGQCMPEVFCVETLEFIRGQVEVKRGDIIEFMQSKGYMVYGDTYINTIFADREKWLGR